MPAHLQIPSCSTTFTYIPDEERRNGCDLIEVFEMFNGYTEIDIRVLFTLDGNNKGLRAIRGRKKICNQIESYTDGTVWTRTLLMYPA